MSTILDTGISFYKNAFESKSLVVKLGDILSMIKNGKYGVKIETMRMLYGLGEKDEYKRHKIQLPAVTFSGQYGERRKVQFLQDYSHIVVFDIDNLTIEECRLIIAKLKVDVNILSSWLSPSGSGIKILTVVECDQSSHKIFFQAIKNYLEKHYSIKVDKSGSDITRLCYLSYDPDLFVKESILINGDFVSQYLNANEDEESQLVIAPKIDLSQMVGQKIQERSGKNKQEDRDMIIKIIKYLKRHGKSITSSYDDWYRVAFGIANTFTLNIGEKYYLELCRQDGQSHDEERSIKMLRYCYSEGQEGKVRINTIIYLAQTQGFDLSKTSFLKSN
jgi:hypothetical protein